MKPQTSNLLLLIPFLIFLLFSLVFSVTDPNDLAILSSFRKGLENSELLKWPENGDFDPCGVPNLPHVVCDGNRVSQIQVQGMNLKGPLPQNLNKLSMLTNLGLQRNQFTGILPSFSGLSKLNYAYLDYNDFDSIPLDFFNGLDNLQVMALDYNPLNSTTGWPLPENLQDSVQLTNLSLMNCNLRGKLPEFLGKMPSLGVLKLSFNRISGDIPASFEDSGLRILWLNEQSGGGMTGGIDVISSMSSLTSLWLHGNHFSGKIPASIGNLSSLQSLNLNSNDFVGLIPEELTNLELSELDLNNNKFVGPVPQFKAVNFSYKSNLFCESAPGLPCSSQVMALLEFLDGVGYSPRLLSSWSGNDNPCDGPWLGLSCNVDQNVSIINLPNSNLSGVLSPSIANLDSIVEINLKSNKLTGSIPSTWTKLKSLTQLDLSNNNLSPPLPKFDPKVKILLNGNPLLNSNSNSKSYPPGSGNSPPGSSRVEPETPFSPSTGTYSSNSTSTIQEPIRKKGSRRVKLVILVAIIVSFAVLSFAVFLFLVVPLCVYIYICTKHKERDDINEPPSLVIHPRDTSDPDNFLKLTVANNNNINKNGGSVSMTTAGSGSGSGASRSESHVIEAGNLVISVKVLRNVTNNFAPENELGRGGFGVVYKGELDDGTKIAVKRMEAGVISTKALDEFQSEIAVLSKVRHRHLVSLLGYSIEGYERILVYEYMPQGALSKHLFQWKTYKLEPLSWKRRLNIALDVARAVEYLHNLAHQSFIHRDLKSSNILLGDDFRAKVSDFGLVKLAPDGEKSVVTQLAGTFGYLAPEYAVTGKITTKADVFSFGVVLMELLTGLTALDEDRPEESQYLAAWFWNIKSDKQKLMAAVDPTLLEENKNNSTTILDAIYVLAELAGHCTAREPGQRPDMGHVVNVLGPLVEKWKPLDDETDDYFGVDFSLPLNQMVKVWQESEGSKDSGYMDLEDSNGSIPSRPTGFADSFTSVDGR